MGCPGTGKTYLTAAAINFIGGRHVHPATKNIAGMRYWSESDLLERVRQSIDKYRDDYITSLKLLIEEPLLFLDDLGSTGLTEWRKEVWFQVIDYRYQAELPTWITSNLYERDFDRDFGERTTSRLFGSENTQINMGQNDLRKEGL